MKTNNLPLEQAKLAFKIKEQEIKVEQIKLHILELLWRIESLEQDRLSAFLTDEAKARIGLKISSRYCEIETLKLDQKLEEMTLANLRNQWTELLVSD